MTIYRQAAIEAVKIYLTDCHVEDAVWHGNGIEYELDNLPSAEPEEKVSRWSDMSDDMYCLACKKPLMDYFHFTEDGSIVEVPNFCPNCGADMRGKKNERHDIQTNGDKSL